VTEDLRPEDIELGDEIEPVIRSRAPIVAVRMSPDLFARLGDYAAARNLTMSDVVRQGVERLLAGATSAATGLVSTGGFLPSNTLLAEAPPARSSARTVTRDVVDESVSDLSLTS
jgi:hypothetical protein